MAMAAPSDQNDGRSPQPVAALPDGQHLQRWRLASRGGLFVFCSTFMFAGLTLGAAVLPPLGWPLGIRLLSSLAFAALMLLVLALRGPKTRNGG
jgi:hypothetical protein